MKRRYVYTLFQRFWHWTQASLIILLAFTGFEVHGTYSVLGFELAARTHEFAAVALLVLVAFTIFWHLTTGGWRHYVPTSEGIIAQARYYTSGIFRNEPHPHKRTEISRLNPLQRLVYLGFKLLIFPVIATSGLLYLFYSDFALSQQIGLATIAFVHVAGAIPLLSFLLVHLYMNTTGHTLFSNLITMITGWETLEHEDEEADGGEDVQPSGASGERQLGMEPGTD